MKKLTGHIKEWLRALLIALVVVVSFVWFIGNWYVVSSGSMTNALLQGDMVYVNKLAYGARLPFTPFSLPFEGGHSSWFSFGYHRLPGFSEVERGDIVAFNYPDLDTIAPVDHKSIWVKRIVALPGDTLVIKKSVATVNGEIEQHDNTLKFNYHVRVNGDEAAFFYKYNLNDLSKISANGDWMVPLSKEDHKKLKKDRSVSYISPEFKKPKDYEEEVFPYELEYKWNQDYYGPIYIPRKGDTIELNLQNIPLYRLCIEAYEGNDMIEKGGQFYINGVETKTYCFKMNYYFVVGDNRHNSSDSRYWGFLPENHLIGRVSGVFFSIDKNRNGLDRIRWSRLFTSCK